MIKEWTNNYTKGTNTKEFIILHHTGSMSCSGTLTRFKNPKSQASCHYVVDRDGTIYQFNSDNYILRHCGVSEWNGRKNLNPYAIGIETVSDGSSFTNKQRDSVRLLINGIAQEYGIPIENILRHKDIAPGRKTDISDKFWNNKYKSFDEYKKDILIPNYRKMLPKQKEKLLKSLKESNSASYDLISGIVDEIEGKDLKKALKVLQQALNHVNKLIRKSGF